MKKGKAKIITLSISALVILVSIIGYTYSFFSADVTYTNKTETVVKTKELNITYTGGQEISEESMIPGDSFIKTFRVKNNSNQTVSFNIYMENITNELKDELRYTLNDGNKDIAFKRVVPKTKNGKTYLETKIEIGSQATKNYTLKIEYMYLDIDQSLNQGATFKATLGIDSDQIEEVYAIRRDIDDQSSAWERMEDSQGLVATATKNGSAVQNDFDIIYPWNEIISYNYDTTSNRITAYYGDENFKFDGSNGEVLTRIPEFYYKREQKVENGKTYEYMYITKNEKEGYTKSESFSVGRYTISGTGEGDIHSRSGQSPLTNKTINDFRTYARSLNKETVQGFGQMDYHYFILQMLYLVEYADYNSQEKLGLGYTSSETHNVKPSGECNTLGMKSGTLNNDGKHSMIYRGIEDIYGNVWQFVDGINVKDNKAYICYNQNEYESDKFDGCYKEIGYTNSTLAGHISKLGYDANHPLISFPIEANPTSTFYIPDYYGYKIEGDIALVGGMWSDNTRNGLWFWYIDKKTSAMHSYYGARLIKIN